MGEEKKFYDGIVPLKDAFKTIVLEGSDTKPYAPRMSIDRQRYNKARSWIKEHADRIVLLEDGKTAVVGKPVFPAYDEFRKRFHMTVNGLDRIAQKYDDRAGLTRVRDDLDEKSVAELCEKSGTEKGKFYIVLKSCYQSLSFLFE